MTEFIKIIDNIVILSVGLYGAIWLLNFILKYLYKTKLFKVFRKWIIKKKFMNNILKWLCPEDHKDNDEKDTR